MLEARRAHRLAVGRQVPRAGGGLLGRVLVDGQAAVGGDWFLSRRGGFLVSWRVGRPETLGCCWLRGESIWEGARFIFRLGEEGKNIVCGWLGH